MIFKLGGGNLRIMPLHVPHVTPSKLFSTLKWDIDFK